MDLQSIPSLLIDFVRPSSLFHNLEDVVHGSKVSKCWKSHSREARILVPGNTRLSWTVGAEGITRSTRSGRFFSSWSGASITSAPDFDLSKVLKLACQTADLPGPHDDRMDDTASPSTPSFEETPRPTKRRKLTSSPTPTTQPEPPPVPQANSTCSSETATSTTPPSTLHASAPQHPVPNHAKRQGHRNRKRKRETDVLERPLGAVPTIGKHCLENAPVPTPFEPSTVRIADTGYVSIRDDLRPRQIRPRKRMFSFTEVHGPNSRFKFDLWKCPEPSTAPPAPIVIASGKVIGLFAAHPKDANWDQVHTQAADLLEASRSEITFEDSDKKHRRGRFHAMATGISHGGGQPRPMNWSHSASNAAVLKRLTSHQVFVRLAHFASSVFATWFPCLFAYYASHFTALLTHDSSLTPLFTASVWAACTFNFGPKTECFDHTDYANLPFGLCAITALGNYDYHKGGHLILWDLCLVLEFPPGSTILIPSAILRHSNTTIGRHERRYSFTQYSAGALFRWVDENFMTSEEYWAGLDEEGRTEALKRRAERWKKGLSMFSTLEDLTKLYSETQKV